MKYTYYIADVFTNQMFDGAQIAVFPNADGLNAKKMALIARELNLTETVFIFHRLNAEHLRRMRIFSPLAEIDFAGHPVIAAAYVLAACGDVTLTEPIQTLLFEQNAGTLEVNISNDQGQPSFVQFTRQVSGIVDRFAPTNEELASFLGLKASEIDHLRYSARLASCGFPYLVVPVWQYESIRKARFNYAAWSQSAAPQTAAQEILLFCPKTPSPDADFNLRLLGPNIGIHADPPVGNSLPAFATYLCSFENTRLGTHTFTVERGSVETRRSVLRVEIDYKREELLTLRVGGEAVLFAQGWMELPPN